MPRRPRSPRVRKGQGSVALDRAEFAARVREQFYDPRFEAVDAQIEPYATSHESLDSDVAFQEEVRNAARSLITLVRDLRAGRVPAPDRGLRDPRPK